MSWIWFGVALGYLLALLIILAFVRGASLVSEDPLERLYQEQERKENHTKHARPAA